MWSSPGPIAPVSDGMRFLFAVATSDIDEIRGGSPRECSHNLSRDYQDEDDEPMGKDRQAVVVSIRAVSSLFS